MGSFKSRSFGMSPPGEVEDVLPGRREIGVGIGIDPDPDMTAKLRHIASRVHDHFLTHLPQFDKSDF